MTAAVSMGCARPFVKWAGGKTGLLGALLPRVRASGFCGQYYEPFLGGGALFFALQAEGLLGAGAILNDQEVRLVNTYDAVKSLPETVIGLLRAHKEKHCKEHYYKQRELLNQADNRTGPGAAARFIYINKTCFNGLWRVNASGAFNVPMGAYKDPLICDEENIRLASDALRAASLSWGGFKGWCEAAVEGDFVYFDPPYWPTSETASFTEYGAEKFGPEKQAELADLFLLLSRRGVRCMLSNSDVPQIRDLYQAFEIDDVSRSGAMNSKGGKRGRVGEVIVRNFDYTPKAAGE